MKTVHHTRGYPITLCCIFLALVFAIGFVGYRYYLSQTERIIREKYQELAAIADLKAGQIVKWRAERLADDLLFLENPAFAESVERFLSNPHSSARRREVINWLSPLDRNHCYHSVIITDIEARERLMLGVETVPVGNLTRSHAFRAMRSGKMIISDLHYGDYAIFIHLDVLIPLHIQRGHHRQLVGAALVRVDPSHELYPLIQTWPTPSRTAETLMVKRDGDQAVYLNELRHQKGTALSLRQPLTKRGLPAARAALGYEGNFQGEDYRGVPVFSVARKIPASPWFLVAKIDAEEVIAPVRYQAWVTGAFSVLLVLFAGMGVGLMWRHTTARYYKRLYQEEREQGELEEHIRLNEARLQSLYNISQYRASNVQALLDFSLAEALRLTSSKFGYIFFYDEEKLEFSLNCWSNDVMKECAVVEPETRYDLDKTGIWGEAVRQRRPIVVNNSQGSNPLKKGYPKGHVELLSYLTIPVFSGKKIVAVVGVANKEGAYDETDVRQLTLLSDSVWKYVERKHTEEELIRLNRELETRVLERTADLESFSYTVSHDLRAPLRAISGFSRILRDDFASSLDAEGCRLLGLIIGNTERMGQLIDDLLSFSRIGRTDLGRSRIDMTRLAADVRDELLSGEAGERLDCRISPLPEAVGDTALIRQVWVNLLSNAVKFTLPKGRGTVDVSGITNGDEQIYTVRDTGVGFDMEYAHKLFGIFQRLHSPMDFEGTGVGLAIVQRIIDRHGGRIWAEGKPGEGATFCFSLPVIGHSMGRIDWNYLGLARFNSGMPNLRAVAASTFSNSLKFDK